MNPIFNDMNQMGNMTGFLQALNQFSQGFRGNPQQQIQQMMNSGQITQEQYNQAVQKASKAIQMSEQLRAFLNMRF